jgi:hypothetical protein
MAQLNDGQYKCQLDFKVHDAHAVPRVMRPYVPYSPHVLDITVKAGAISLTQVPHATGPNKVASGRWDPHLNAYSLDTGLFAGGSFTVLDGQRGQLEVWGSGVPLIDLYQGDIAEQNDE